MAVPLDYGTNTNIVTDMGIIGLPVAGPVGPTQLAIVQLYAPWAIKTVKWSGVVLGEKPILPDPNTGGPLEILVGKHIAASSPVTNPDQSQAWTVSGTYTYHMLQPPSDVNNLGSGVNPYLDLAQIYTELAPSDFVVGIIPAAAVNPEFVGFPFTGEVFQGLATQQEEA